MKVIVITGIAAAGKTSICYKLIEDTSVKRFVLFHTDELRFDLLYGDDYEALRNVRFHMVGKSIVCAGLDIVIEGTHFLDKSFREHFEEVMFEMGHEVVYFGIDVSFEDWESDNVVQRFKDRNRKEFYDFYTKQLRDISNIVMIERGNTKRILEEING